MKLFLFGATGWIGKQVLEVLGKIASEYQVFALTANRKEDRLLKILKKWKAKYGVVTGKKTGKYRELFYGTEKIPDLIEESDVILFACAGTSLARYLFYALEKNKKILLSNKEIIVSFGEIMSQKYIKKILPIDSEHSSLFQLLKKFKFSEIKKVAITASGGPFFRRKSLKRITIKQALKHPVWRMGKKITIDSATMMNKSLEIIEAHYLFKIPPSKIDVIVHPQSIVHSLVFTNDDTVFANMFYPDMKYPILYALGFPERKPNNFRKIDFENLKMNFYTLNRKENKAIDMGYFSIENKKGYPAVLNFANEEAVKFFLKGKIKFNQIIPLVEKTINSYKPFKVKTLDDIYGIEKWTRNKIREFVK